MSPRALGVLAAAATAVLAAAAWLAMPRQDASAGGPALPGLREAVNEVTEIRIVRGAAAATLRKGEAGWVVAERDYPADSGRVRKLLLDLAALGIVEAKTSDPANYARLGVQDVDGSDAAGTTTRIELALPERSLALLVGKPSGAKSSFVRPVDSAQALLASPQISADAEPGRWIERTLADVPAERVREVAVTPAKGRAYRAARASPETADFTVADLPRGRELASQATADSLGAVLAGFTIDDVRAAAGEPAAGAAPRLTLHTFDGLEVQLTGREDGARRYVALSARAGEPERQAEAQALNARAAGREFELPAYRYDGLFRPLEELLAPAK